jgi:hypothetical protein
MSGGGDHWGTVLGLAVAYCEAIHHSRPAVFEDMCHERFTMTAVSAAGEAEFWDKAAYLKRRGARALSRVAVLRDPCRRRRGRRDGARPSLGRRAAAPL